MLRSIGLWLTRLDAELRKPGKINRWFLRPLGAHWHWQNFSAEKQPGAWPRHGRAWLHRGARSYGFEWVLFRWRCGASIETREQGRELGLHVAPIIASLYLTLPCPRWFARLLPLHHYIATWDNNRPGSYPEDREIEISAHSGSLWWSIWQSPMEWSSGTPRWRHGSFNPVDFLLGRARCETIEGNPEPALVPMPEGNYAATIKREDRVWRRPRWPFVRRRTDYWIEIPSGIPFEGKGENSWDCGTDGLFGTGGNSPENAIANAVASVMKNRKRYGTPREIREAEPRMAQGLVH